MILWVTSYLNVELHAKRTHKISITKVWEEMTFRCKIVVELAGRLGFFWKMFLLVDVHKWMFDLSKCLPIVYAS